MSDFRKVDDSELTEIAAGSTSLSDVQEVPDPPADGPTTPGGPGGGGGGGIPPEEDNPGGGFENMEQSE